MFIMLEGKVVLILLCAAIVASIPVEKCENRRPLDEHIQHFEPVHYDLEEFGHRHRRAVRNVRDLGERHEVAIRFHAHGRHFHLSLRPDTSDLASHADIRLHTAEGYEVAHDYDPNSFLVGHVVDDTGSKVAAFNDDGIMSANIHCSHGSYYLKPARDHFNTSQTFHSVIYRQADISTWPVSMLRNATMRPKLEKQSLCGDAGGRLEDDDHDIMAESAQQRQEYFEKVKSGRTRRETKRRYARFVCTVALYADYHFFSSKAGSDKNRAISVMRLHVSKSNNIFTTSDFDSNGDPDGFRFKIGRITIVTDSTTGPFAGPTDHYNTGGAGGKAIDTRLYLRVFSTISGHEDFCEAIAFTNIDFDNGVLGLAYLRPSGICAEKHRKANPPFQLNGQTYDTFTANTAFVSFVNHGVPQNDGITEIVFVHELGHNWGTGHDDRNGVPVSDAACVPGATSTNGNFIMFSKASDGTKPNNGVFSTCSRKNINSNVDSLQRSRPDCFSDDPDAFCGNGVVEEGEECDCGTGACSDACCNQYNISDKSGNCKVNKTRGFTCSPTKGECCTDMCQVIGAQPATAATTSPATATTARATTAPVTTVPVTTTPATTAPATTAPVTTEAVTTVEPSGAPAEMEDGVTNSSMEATTTYPTTTRAVSTAASSSGVVTSHVTSAPVTKAGKQKCGVVDSCQVQTFCSGAAECPTPVNKPDHSLCTPVGVDTSKHDFQQACLNGFCSESACRASGHQPCSCGATSCQVCCRIHGECVNTHKTPVTGKGITLRNLFLPPGAPCNNYNGICNTNAECKDIDLNTGLNGVNNLFDQKALNAIVIWLRNNWFWVLVIIAAIIIVAVAVHFTYKWKKKHDWTEGKQLAYSATKRLGKSLRGPKGTQRRGARSNNIDSMETYDIRTCARRMKKMFPTAGYEVLMGAAREVNDEETAVTKILDQGFKMCKW
ncbi:disintegrin and metalloproteinase domain-containing protein 10-like [Sycon ciliatum]|uniref:disintegrin and metalloproteinase domain-containing protein 10-like n=1 Tax=Sycon ciliatum TaxID=27933 RepID=UPI0031F68366